MTATTLASNNNNNNKKFNRVSVSPKISSSSVLNLSSDSDSDDTAELMRQLKRAKKSTPSKLASTFFLLPSVSSAVNAKNQGNGNTDKTITNEANSDGSKRPAGTVLEDIGRDDCDQDDDFRYDDDDDDDSVDTVELAKRLPTKPGVQRPEYKPLIGSLKGKPDERHTETTTPEQAPTTHHSFKRNADATNTHTASPIIFRLPDHFESSSSESESSDPNDEKGDDNEEVRDTELERQEFQGTKTPLFPNNDKTTKNNNNNNTVTESQLFDNGELCQASKNTSFTQNPYMSKRRPRVHDEDRSNQILAGTGTARYGYFHEDGEERSGLARNVATDAASETAQGRFRDSRTDCHHENWSIQDTQKTTDELFLNEVRGDTMQERWNVERGAMIAPSLQLPCYDTSHQEEDHKRAHNHTYQQQQQQQLTQTEDSLFQKAFLDESIHSSNQPRKSDRHQALPHHQHDHRSQEELFRAAFLDENTNNNLAHNTQHGQSEFIDLVDDSGGEERTNNQHYNENITGRFPSNSPRYNILARSFIHDNSSRFEGPMRTGQDNDEIFIDDFPVDENESNNRKPAPSRITLDHARYVNQPEAQHRQATSRTTRQSTSLISRPWPSNHSSTQRLRRMRDPAATNVSSVASVVTKRNRAPAPAAFASVAATAANHDTANQTSIRRFLTRPRLVDQSTQHMKEQVKSSRHDLQGHADVTVIDPSIEASRNRPACEDRENNYSHNEMEEEVDDDIEGYDEEIIAPTRRSSSSARAAKQKGTKRKRGTASTSKSKKGKKKRGGGKRRNKSSSGGGSGRRRGAGKYSRNGNRNDGGGGGSGGAWGGGNNDWSSAPPVRREDPAFQNIGAEISF
jgi:hypothetical protein